MELKVPVPPIVFLMPHVIFYHLFPFFFFFFLLFLVEAFASPAPCSHTIQYNTIQYKQCVNFSLTRESIESWMCL